MTHPTDQDLALFAGGDLRFLRRFSLTRHLRACERCQSEVEAYRCAALQFNSDLSTLPNGLNWERLAAEMTGNIRVAVAAGECVGARPTHTRKAPWGVAAAAAAFVFILAGAWWTKDSFRVPAQLQSRPYDVGIVLEYTPSGVAMKENGSSLTLVHPVKAERSIAVSSPGLLRVRYVDGDTGRVTINNVYAQ